MKKRKLIVFLFLIVAGVLLWSIFPFGWRYQSPTYIAKTIDSNLNGDTSLNRKTTISLSVTESANKQNDYLLVLNEELFHSSQYMQYEFSDGKEEFIGERFIKDDQLVVKNPMYQKYIVFPKQDTRKLSPEVPVESKEIMMDWIQSLSKESINVYKDKAGLEEGIFTIKVQNQNEALNDALSSKKSKDLLSTYLDSVISENTLIKNKLLKQGRNDSKLKIASTLSVKTYEEYVQHVLEQSIIKHSDVILKFDKEKNLKQLSMSLDMKHTNRSGKSTDYVVNITTSFSELDKSKTEGLKLNATNSLPYQDMQDEVDYFQNQNSEFEKDAELELNLPHVKVEDIESSIPEENTMTLEDIGEFKDL